MCNELSTLLLMAESTRNGFTNGFPTVDTVVFPEAYMFVVPTDSKYFENGLFRKGHRVKKEQSLGVLPPARDRVFTDCRMMITVTILLWNRQHMIKDFSKFYR